MFIPEVAIETNNELVYETSTSEAETKHCAWRWPCIRCFCRHTGRKVPKLFGLPIGIRHPSFCPAKEISKFENEFENQKINGYDVSSEPHLIDCGQHAVVARTWCPTHQMKVLQEQNVKDKFFTIFLHSSWVLSKTISLAERHGGPQAPLCPANVRSRTRGQNGIS